jgi:hypothetical protein
MKMASSAAVVLPTVNGRLKAAWKQLLEAFPTEPPPPTTKPYRINRRSYQHFPPRRNQYPARQSPKGKENLA